MRAQSIKGVDPKKLDELRERMRKSPLVVLGEKVDRGVATPQESRRLKALTKRARDLDSQVLVD